MKRINIPVPFAIISILALILGMLGFIKLPCPTCEGTGILTIAPNLRTENIQIHKIQCSGAAPGCGYNSQVVYYFYNVTALVINAGTQPVAGNINVIFYEPGDGEPSREDEVQRFPVEVDLLAGETLNLEQQFYVRAWAPCQPTVHRVAIQTNTLGINQNTDCPVCDGTGKLAFYEWLGTKIK
jgi:hypothetical protein